MEDLLLKLAFAGSIFFAFVYMIWDSSNKRCSVCGKRIKEGEPYTTGWTGGGADFSDVWYTHKRCEEAE